MQPQRTRLQLKKKETTDSSVAIWYLLDRSLRVYSAARRKRREVLKSINKWRCHEQQWTPKSQSLPWNSLQNMEGSLQTYVSNFCQQLRPSTWWDEGVCVWFALSTLQTFWWMWTTVKSGTSFLSIRYSRLADETGKKSPDIFWREPPVRYPSYLPLCTIAS